MPGLIFRHCLLFILISVSTAFNVHAQVVRDTSLVMMMSRPFYYNVVKDWKEGIYAGTSSGIYRLNGTQAVRVSDSAGYLKLNALGGVMIDREGAGNHQSADMLHLLPYPTQKRDEYHAGNRQHLYVTSAGSMHIFEMLPYSRSYKNVSIRTISDHFTGTYSGIYFDGRLLPHPVSSFSDGYVREYNGKVFMCTHGLDIFDLEALQSGARPASISPPTDIEYVPARDIRYMAKPAVYLIASGNRLSVMDSSLTNAKTCFTGEDEVVLLNEIPPYNVMVFASGRRLYHYYPEKDRIDTLEILAEPIKDGYSKQQSNLILAANGLYLESSDKGFERIVQLSKAHTMRAVDDNNVIIATDEGLFLYRLDQRKLETLVPGVEFNRRGLHIKDGKLYAGSISGLYTLDLSQLDEIIGFHKVQESNPERNPALIWMGAGLLLLAGSLLWVMMSYRKRLRRLQTALETSNPTPVKARLSREDITTFIRDNMATASLKTICHHFDTNHTMVYTVLSPDKPGDLIQQLRYEAVRSLHQQGSSVAEISSATGLSESYVRRIRKRPVNENAPNVYPGQG